MQQQQSLGFGGVQQQPLSGAPQLSPGYGGVQPQPSFGAQQPQQPQGDSSAQQPSFGAAQQPPGFGNLQSSSSGGTRGLSGNFSTSAFGATQRQANSMPISALSAYTPGKWQIKARITHKSDIRKFNNAKGEGQLFKIDLIDKTGEISATFFGSAVTKFYDMLQPQQVYYFSRGSVKAANKRWDKGEFVLTFDEHTSIEASEDDREIPGTQYLFVPLADVDSKETGSLIDIKAVIFEVREAFSVVLRKTNEERPKRELVLWDDSGAAGSSFLELTIWGQNSHDNFEAGTVIYAKSMRVSEWNGAKSLNGSSGYELNPDNPQAFALRRKFEEKRPNMATGGPARSSKMVSGNRESIEEIREADMSLGPPPAPGQPLDPTGPRSVIRHYVSATLTSVPNERPPYYAACPAQVEKAPSGTQQQGAQMRTCNRKVTQNGGMWQCQSGHQCERPVHRYLVNRALVVDHTGCLDISFFDEAGRQIFGCDADDIAALYEDPSREEELQQRFSQLAWKRYLFRVSSKKEMWQDELRVRLTAEEGAPLNLAREGHRMLAEVKAALQTPQDVPGAGGA
jgi:replication factor A1